MYDKITHFYKAAEQLERTNNALETACNTKNFYKNLVNKNNKKDTFLDANRRKDFSS